MLLPDSIFELVGSFASEETLYLMHELRPHLFLNKGFWKTFYSINQVLLINKGQDFTSWLQFFRRSREISTFPLTSCYICLPSFKRRKAFYFPGCNKEKIDEVCKRADDLLEGINMYPMRKDLNSALNQVYLNILIKEKFIVYEMADYRVVFPRSERQGYVVCSGGIEYPLVYMVNWRL
nr:hypothetical protein Clen_420 [Cedratvirus lena]